MIMRIQKKAFIFCEEDNVKFIIQEFFNVFRIKGAQNTGNKLTINNKDYIITITVLSKNMNSEIRTFINEQIESSCEYFRKIKTKYVNAQINLLHEIELSNSLITIDYSYKKDRYKDKEKPVFTLVFNALRHLSGILIYDNGRACYTYFGKIILNYKGDTEISNFMPFNKVRIDKVLEDENNESYLRRKENLFLLRGKGIYVTNDLLLIPDREKVKLKPIEEIAKSLITLMITSVYSESLLKGKDINEAKILTEKIISKYKAQDFFTEKEKVYLESKELNKDIIKSYLRYERLYIMEWVLGFVYDIPFPERKCDAAFIVELLLKYDSVEDIVKNAEVRHIDNILNEADLASCLNWACKYADKFNLKAPSNMDKYIVYERYEAFKFLGALEV